MLKRLVIIGFLLSVRMFAQTTISNVYVQSSTATTATIVWTTSTPATSQILYGYDIAIHYSNNENYSYVTSHSMTLTVLNAAQPYYFAVVSVDGSGHSAQSSTVEFALCGQSQVPVSGTINQFYYSGTFSITWNPPSGSSGTPTACGVPVTTPVTGNLNLSGSFSAQVADSLKVTPGPGTWTVAVADIGDISPISVTLPLSATTQDISAQLQAAAAATSLVGVIANNNAHTVYPPWLNGSGSNGCLGNNTIANGCTGATTASGAWTNIFSGAGIATNCAVLSTGSGGALTCSPTSYLPLSGGKITGSLEVTGPTQLDGALTGTSASFSGNVVAGAVMQSSDPTDPLQDATKRYTDISGSRQAVQPLMACIANASRDCRQLIIGDSTGAGIAYSYVTNTYPGQYRWPWRTAQMMATRFPNYAVKYRAWDTSAFVVATPLAGTGYACGDTGTISGGTSGYLATYSVLNNSASCSGTGIPSTLTITFQGTGYITYNSALTTTTTSGSGTGMTVATTQLGYWSPYQQLNTPVANNYMGDVTVTSAGSGQTATAGTTIYDSGTGSVACVANPGTSHCASIVIVVAGGIITSAQASNFGNLNAGDSYTSPPIFNLTSLGGTPGTVVASLNFTLYIDSMSVSGSSPRIIQGANYASVITSQVPADLVIFNQGFNLGAAASQPNGMVSPATAKSSLITMGETVAQGEPQAGIMVLNQSPDWADGIHNLAQQTRSNYLGQIAANRGYGLINSYSLMLEDSNWQADYFYFNVASATAGSGYTPGTYTVTGTCSGGANPVLTYTILLSGSMDTSFGLPTSPEITSAGTCPSTSIPTFTLPMGGATVTATTWSGGGVHGNDYWFQVLSNYMMRSFVYSPDTSMFTRPPSSFESAGDQQLLTNSDFSAWSGGPTGWTSGGSPTITQNTTIYERGSFSVSVFQSGVSSYLFQSICTSTATCAGYWGKIVTLAVREYVMPNASPTNAGSVQISSDLGYARSYINNGGEGMGGWAWNTTTYTVPYGAGYVRGYLWTSTTNEAQTVLWQSASMTVGSLPHDTLGTPPLVTTFPNITSNGPAIVNGAAGTNRQFVWQTSGSDRWVLQAGTDAESGSNVGSTFYLTAYSDTGTQIDNVLTVTRAATGAIQWNSTRPFYTGTQHVTGYVYSTLGFANSGSYSNAALQVPTTGPVAFTGVAGNVALTANNSSGSPTADLIQATKGVSTLIFRVDNSGAVYAQNGNTVYYRCTTAGTLPIGALTSVAANCGAYVDSGLRGN